MVKMKNKTAIEFLYEFVQLKLTHEQQSQFEGLFEQAKEMEEEQIAAAFDCGYSNGEGVYQDNPIFHGCNYYDETFKSK